MADGTVVLKQTSQAQEINNVLVFANIPEDAQGRQSFADNLRASFVTNTWASSKHTGWSLDSLLFVYNDSLPIYSVEVDFTAGPLNGADPGDPLPNQIALLVSTQRVGTPPNRGRIYWGGYTEGSIASDGRFDTASVTEAENQTQDLVDGISYTGGAGVAYLRIARRNLTGDLSITNAIETVVARGIPATQRRRRQGVGI